MIHGATENPSPAPQVHLVELIVAPGALSYFIEVRQRPGTVIFDAVIPVPAGAPGVVLVTRATENASLSNTFERPVQAFGVLTTGQSVVDALRLLRIEAQAVINANPLTYRVIVHWNEEPPENPNGLFDLRITPWNTETWETPDIWINSKLNDGATMIFSSFEGGDNTKPALNGDKPWVRHDNTIFARVTNSGVQAVNDVLVTAYTASPPGIGDNGSWQTLKTVSIPTIAANSSEVAPFTWRPREDAHSCVQVAIYPQPGEIQPKNNRAQENFFEFDSAGSSSHEPVILGAEVRSPFTVWRRVDVVVQGLPAGWHAVVDRAWVWVEPKGAVPVTAVIWTDLDSPRADGHTRIVDEAFARVEGWTDFHKDRYLPIGGILAKVRANKRTRIVFEAVAEAGGIRVRGALTPAAADVRGVVEITNAAGVAQMTPFISNAQGAFENVTAVPDGGYDVQIFSASTRRAAEAASVVRHIDVPS